MSAKYRILLALNASDAQLARVRAVDPDRVEVRLLPADERRLLRGRRIGGGAVGPPPAGTESRLNEALAWAQAMVCDQSAVREWLPERAPGLEWIQVTNAGVDYLVRRGLHRLPFTITNARGIHGRNMAEYVLLVCLAFTKGLVPGYLAAQRAKQWSASQPDELAGKTLSIVCYGEIGRGVAGIARAFDMRVLAPRRRAAGHPEPGADVVYPISRLHQMLAECDFVLVATPWTPETHQLIGAAELAAMKPSAVLINIGRGAVVDEAALIAALEAGRLRGAGLDVFAEEPLPPASPLWEMPNVLITPHIAGNTPRYYDLVLDVFCDSLRSVLAGGKPRNIVDVEAGY